MPPYDGYISNTCGLIIKVSKHYSMCHRLLSMFGFSLLATLHFSFGCFGLGIIGALDCPIRHKPFAHCQIHAHLFWFDSSIASTCVSKSSSSHGCSSLCLTCLGFIYPSNPTLKLFDACIQLRKMIGPPCFHSPWCSQKPVIYHFGLLIFLRNHE